MNTYPGNPPLRETSNIPGTLILDKKRVNDAVSCFNALPNAGQFNQANYKKDTFPSYRLTRYKRQSNRLKNHFQGIVRLKDGVHFVASVGDVTDKKAVLVVFKHDSHITQAGTTPVGPVGSNMKFDTQNNDEIVELLLINENEPDLWHPGGLGLMGDIVAVPLENFDDDILISTRVDFYNFSNPLQPTKLHISITCQKRFGAVDIAKLPDGRFICILYSNPLEAFRIYISNSNDLNDGFNTVDGSGDDVYHQEILHSAVVGLRRHVKDAAFQSLQILQQNDDQIFLLASGNFSNVSPTINGRNYCVILKLTLFDPLYQLSYVDHLLVDSEDDYSNFDAGFGLYVQNQNRIGIYSIYHWRAQRYLKWAEYFGREVPVPSQSNDIKDAFIEIYSIENFQDKSLILYGDDIKDLLDYSKIIVQKEGFEKQAMSIRFRLPDGTSYKLYGSNNGRSSGSREWITLKGDGTIQELLNLNDPFTPGLRRTQAFGKKIVSSAFI